MSPSLSIAHREEVEEEERRERRRRDREAREREARQALLVHWLQTKVSDTRGWVRAPAPAALLPPPLLPPLLPVQVMEYKERCQSLELQLKVGHGQLMSTQVNCRLRKCPPPRLS